MDLIGTLAGTLGVDSLQAQALAGTVLGGVRRTLAEQSGEQAASRIDEAVPELKDWTSAASTLMGGGATGSAPSAGGGLGGLLGALGGGNSGGGLMGGVMGALGGQELRSLTALADLMGKVGLDGTKATMVAPLVLNFLKSRMDPGTLQQILSVAPLLGGGSDAKPGSSSGGGLLGGLGGLFGG